jgi:hypothetical protein
MIMWRHSILTACLLLGTAPLHADERSLDMSGKKELGMQHCPSAVSGATTRVSDIAAGVEVTVQAPRDLIAQQEIRRRAQYQLEVVDQPERSAIEHTGLGTGSGKYGYCPGILVGTSLAIRWLPDGVVMTIRADRPGDVRALQKSTHRRARALAKKMHWVATS